MAKAITNMHRTEINLVERDAATVLRTVLLSALAMLATLAVLRSFLGSVPTMVALTTVVSLIVFAGMVARAIATRSHATPRHYKADPPVLQMRVRQQRRR